MKKGEEKIKKKEKNLTLLSKLQNLNNTKTLENTTCITLNLCEQSEKNVRGKIRIKK